MCDIIITGGSGEQELRAGKGETLRLFILYFSVLWNFSCVYLFYLHFKIRKQERECVWIPAQRVLKNSNCQKLKWQNKCSQFTKSRFLKEVKNQTKELLMFQMSNSSSQVAIMPKKIWCEGMHWVVTLDSNDNGRHLHLKCFQTPFKGKAVFKYFEDIKANNA